MSQLAPRADEGPQQSRLRSETRPPTGVAMMLRYGEGLWPLDDPATRCLPWLETLQVVAGTDADGTLVLLHPAIMRAPMTRTAD